MRHLTCVAVALVVSMAGVGGCSGEPAALDVGEGPLVYVVMGNSLMFDPSPLSVMNRYGDMLEADFGVEVSLRDHTVGAQRTDHFLERLRTDERLRKDLSEADVVLVVFSNDEWAEPAMTIMGSGGRDPATCGGDDGRECFREVIDDYNRMVDESLDELTALVDPSKALIRITDFYLFTDGPGGLDGAEFVERLGPLWKEAQDHVEEAAERHGIPVAQVWDVFMGSNGDELPEEKGLIAYDGIHPTEEGTKVMAQVIHDLGYELVG